MHSCCPSEGGPTREARPLHPMGRHRICPTTPKSTNRPKSLGVAAKRRSARAAKPLREDTRPPFPTPKRSARAAKPLRVETRHPSPTPKRSDRATKPLRDARHPFPRPKRSARAAKPLWEETQHPFPKPRGPPKRRSRYVKRPNTSDQKTKISPSCEAATRIGLPPFPYAHEVR